MIVDGVKINYGIIDQTIDEDTVTDGSSENSEFSDVQNTIGVSTTKTKIAYLEKDYFELSGEHVFPEEDTEYNVGWESESLSDESGNISEYIEYVFANTHDSYGIQITFPDGCAPDTFKIAYYNGSSLVDEKTVTGNTLQVYSNYDVRLQWNRVRITFAKINPQQRARLWQVVLGINDIYDEDMLISVSASSATDLAGDYDDCGEFSFQFFNDGRFDVSTINDLPIGLQEGLKVTVLVKPRGSDAYVVYGNYYSESTNVEENGRIITVSGYDELYRLNDTTFQKGVVYTSGRSLYDWAQEVADDAGIDIEIDDAFKSIMSSGYITEVPHREALRLIAEAGCGILLVSSDGKIQLKKHTPKNSGVISNDEIVEGSYLVESGDKYLGVNVIKYSYSAASEAQEVGYLEEVGLTAEPQEIEITYSTFPVIVSTVQVFVDTTTSAQISDLKVYSDRCVFNITGTDGDSSFVTVTGTPYNNATTSVTRGSTIKNIKKIENNYLITGDLADDVADYQYSRVVGKYKHTLEMVSDKIIGVSDEVDVNTGDETENVYVTKQGFGVAYLEQTERVEGVGE